MSKSDAFIDRGHEELERWRKRMAEMEAMGEESRRAFEGYMNDMKARMKQAEDDLKKAREASSAQAADYQDRLKEAWAAMEAGFDNAMKAMRKDKE